MADHGHCPNIITHVISFAGEKQGKSAAGSNPISGSPLAGRKRFETEIFCHISNIEPGREPGSDCPDRDQNTAVEARTVGVEPLQPVNGRRAGLGVVERKKLSIHGDPGRACALLWEPVGGFGSGLDMQAVTCACVVTSARGLMVPTARMSSSATSRTGIPEDVAKRRPRTTASSTESRTASMPCQTGGDG